METNASKQARESEWDREKMKEIAAMLFIANKLLPYLSNHLNIILRIC